MANLPTSSVIAPANPNLEGQSSGMNAGGSDSVIGICTDEPNPKASDWVRIVMGATKNPIGKPTGAQYLLRYEDAVFNDTPVGFAPADAVAAPGELYANNPEGSGFSLINRTEGYTTEIGDWLWGSAAEVTEPLYYSSGDPDGSEWRTNGAGTTQQDGTEFIRFNPDPNKLECWNDTSGITGTTLQYNANYRVEVTLGDSTAGTVTCLIKNSSNDDLAISMLTPNTAGSAQGFIFKAKDTLFLQINLKTSLGTGYLQCGKLEVWGPL